MPKIQWTDLPPALREHLFDRFVARHLYKLKRWRETAPTAPDGPWFKDFGSCKIRGQGKFPKTFLIKRRAAKGKPS